MNLTRILQLSYGSIAGLIKPFNICMIEKIEHVNPSVIILKLEVWELRLY